MNEKTPVHCEHSPDVPLREYIERVLDERDKAVQVAWRNMELRLDKLNELRNEVQEDRGQFVRFDLYEQRHLDMAKRIEDIQTWETQHKELPVHPQAAKDIDDIYKRLKPLEVFHSRAILIAAGLVSVSAVVGAAIARAVLGA